MDSEIKEDARKFGLILEGFDEDDEGTGIWAEHEGAVTAFCRVNTQWRWISPGDGTARRVGLDYTAVERALHLAGIEMTPELFAELQVIEAGVIDPKPEGFEE